VTPWRNSKPPRILSVDEPAPAEKKDITFNDAPPLPVFEFHPHANAFPLMEGEEFDELVADIKARGLREPIVLLDGMVLDGRNRYRACQEAQVPFRAICFPADLGLPAEADALDFVWSKNRTRRHLTKSQKAYALAELFKWKQGGDRRSDQAATLAGRSQEEVAKEAGVSERLLQRAATVEKHAEPELKAAVVRGDVPLHVAAPLAKQPPEEQRTAVAAPKPAKARAAPKPKAAKSWNGPAPIRPFNLLVEQVRGREAEAAGLLRDEHEDDIDVLILLAKELAAIRRGPEDVERAP
jgi:ParB-like nuclease domain